MAVEEWGVSWGKIAGAVEEEEREEASPPDDKQCLDSALPQEVRTFCLQRCVSGPRKRMSGVWTLWEYWNDHIHG